MTRNERLANEQLVMFTKRALKYVLITAPLTVGAVAITMWGRPLGWPAILTGLMVLGTGAQVALQHRQIARLAPEQARPWIMQVAYVLYIMGSLLLGAGILAAIRRFTA